MSLQLCKEHTVATLKNKNICILIGRGKDMLRGGGQKAQLFKVHKLLFSIARDFF